MLKMDIAEQYYVTGDPDRGIALHDTSMRCQSIPRGANLNAESTNCEMMLDP